MKYITAVILIIFSQLTFAANPNIVIDTNKGKITLELYADKAPKTVANFLQYIENDQFKGTIFHRVIKDFMIQGGGFLASGQRAETFAPIQNEASNGLSNDKGTIAMARTNNPHSASRQFFINHKDNNFLNAQGNQAGYAVFGKVTSGMQVVDNIAKVKTGTDFKTGAKNKPVEDVIINSITLQ